MIGVIILAAGSGTRMNLGYNKMLYMKDGMPLYMHTLKAFKDFEEIVLVVNRDDIIDINVPKNVKIVIGGSIRSESVYNGLNAINSEYVLIHDGARAYVSKDIIGRCIEATKIYDAFFVGVKLKDTIKEINDNQIRTLDREKLMIAQTPQGGKTKLFKEVYEKGMGMTFFDDVSLVEKYSNTKIGIVLGDYQNIKITTMEDIL